MEQKYKRTSRKNVRFIDANMLTITIIESRYLEAAPAHYIYNLKLTDNAIYVNMTNSMLY